MLCRVEMPTNEQIYGRFYRWKLMHLGGMAGLFSVFGIPVLGLLAAYFLWTTGAGLTTVLAIAAVALGYTIYLLYIKPSMEFKKREGVALQTEVFIFTDTGFSRVIRSEESGVKDNSSAQYNLVQTAVETGQDFYLFTSRTQAYLVDKEYFTKGSPDDLRATLKTKLGSKFKTKVK